MACEATCVGTSALPWSSRSEPAPTGSVLGRGSKNTILQIATEASPLPEDKTYKQKPRPQISRGPLSEILKDSKLISKKRSSKVANPHKQDIERCENSKPLLSGCNDEACQEIGQIGASSVQQLQKPVAAEAKDAHFYLSQSPETTLQDDHLETHYNIPTIYLEPPASPGHDSTLGYATHELSSFPYCTGLPSFNSLCGDELVEQHKSMTSTNSQKSDVSLDPSIELPSRYQRRLKQDAENGNELEEDSAASSEEDMIQREEDLGTALKWIRQEILEMKEQDKSLLKQFIELRASILQLRCVYDLDLHGSCSDISSVGSGSTYSLNEPSGGGGGLNYASSSASICNNINKIHVNSSSNCNVLKSPHQLRRMLLMSGGSDLGRGGVRGQSSGSGSMSLSLPNSPRVARLRWRSDEII